MGSPDFNETRSKTASKATGVVLEIGFGSGYNLPFYKDVQRLFALEPSQELYAYAQQKIESVSFPIEYLQNAGENIPLSNNSVDSVVSTWTLCSVKNLSVVLKEIYRVLKPGGVFLFAEHGLSPKWLNASLQRVVTPVTKRFTGNCHLSRDIEKEFLNAGFRIKELEKSPEEGRPLMFSYRGVAVK